MTLKKIAEMANVSLSTASRALNNSYGISADTRARVLQAAEKCGYFAEKKRVKLENRRADELNIAILCPEIISSYYSRIAALLVTLFREKNCRCTIYNTEFDDAVICDMFKKCAADPDTDAIICLFEQREWFETTDIPVITLGLSDKFSCIETDMAFGIELACEHIKSIGKKRIAFAGENLTAGKEEYFSDACKSLGLNISGIFRSQERFENAGRAAAEYFSASDSLPEAVICAYDEIALGLIDGLHARGIHVPQDISVIGINDIPCAQFCFGGLSTVGFDHSEAFEKMVDDIISDKKSGTVKTHSYRIPARLILRNTD